MCSTQDSYMHNNNIIINSSYQFIRLWIQLVLSIKVFQVAFTIIRSHNTPQLKETMSQMAENLGA